MSEGFIEEVRGSDLRVGDVIVVQAIPVQTDTLTRAERHGMSVALPWHLQGRGTRLIRDDDHVLRLVDA